MIDFAKLVVHESDYWIWQVHENQFYLGRFVLRLKRSLESSCAYCTESEWSALRIELVKYERFMDSCFLPDRFNYAQLGNIYPQLHFHAVPRYRSVRRWQNFTFLDTHWGRNWSPTPSSPLSLEQTYEFATWIGHELEDFLRPRKEAAL